MCPAPGFHWILSPQVKFVLFPWYSCLSCLCLNSISISVSALFSFFFPPPLSAQKHTLSLTHTHAYTHTLSLGYYQDKSIWSIQGSGCHFIHIFSSLVTLLKATASIYPEWMNAPTDETQEKMRPTQPEMTTANQPVIFKHVLKFCVLYAIENSLVILKLFGTMFSIHLRVKRHRAARPPPNDKRMAVETSSLGGKNEMLQSVEARSRESWRRDKNVSIHANWCPDPPPGCHCLLSGEGIKGPFTRHEDFHCFSNFHSAPSRPAARTPFRSAMIPNRCRGGELFPLRFIQGKKTEKAGSVSLRWIWRCQSAHGQLVFQSRGEGQIEFRVSAMTDGCRGTLVSAAAPQRPGLTGC